MTARIRDPYILPRLKDPQLVWSQAWGQQIVKALTDRANLDKTPLVAGYTVSNYTETRTLNAGTATATDVANFVATLVSDLIAAGKIGGA